MITESCIGREMSELETKDLLARLEEQSLGWGTDSQKRWTAKEALAEIKRLRTLIRDNRALPHPEGEQNGKDQEAKTETKNYSNYSHENEN